MVFDSVEVTPEALILPSRSKSGAKTSLFGWMTSSVLSEILFIVLEVDCSIDVSLSLSMSAGFSITESVGCCDVLTALSPFFDLFLPPFETVGEGGKSLSVSSSCR